jgi:hypothetical protein
MSSQTPKWTEQWFRLAEPGRNEVGITPDENLSERN